MELIKTSRPALVEGGQSKTDISKLASEIINESFDRGNVLELVEKIAATEELIKQIKGDVAFKNYALEKIENGYTSESGTRIEQCEAGTKYHFEKCNDPVLRNLYTRREVIDDKIKEREAFLKTVPSSGIEILFGDELVKVYHPYKTSVTTYKVTLSK